MSPGPERRHILHVKRGEENLALAPSHALKKQIKSERSRNNVRDESIKSLTAEKGNDKLGMGNDSCRVYCELFLFGAYVFYSSICYHSILFYCHAEGQESPISSAFCGRVIVIQKNLIN